MRRITAVLLCLLVPAMVFAQSGTVTGKVTVVGTGEPVTLAHVEVEGWGIGTATDLNGEFKLIHVPAGTQTVKATHISYVGGEQEIDLSAGGSASVDFVLEVSVLRGESVTLVATRAVERETPVAFTNLKKEEIQVRLGGRDLPEVLNETPGVYATAQGGGAGDARLNIRGFNQRNVAVMINGVPVNDMENGWVYWSNWDGLSDAANSIQIQRGLGASNLAIASVGGTMNIVTDVAGMERGLSFKQEIGSGWLNKTTVSGASGLMADKFAGTFTVSRKIGYGVVDKAWTDAWSYFAGLSYIASSTNKIDLFVVGAPQRHGQRYYSREIGYFDKEYAESLGADVSGGFGYQNVPGDYGVTYNSHWGGIQGDPAKLKEYFNGETHDLWIDDVIMERENYYHKPQFNLNWYFNPTDKLSITNVVYYSYGLGGGSGPLGAYSEQLNSGQIDYQSLYNFNNTNVDADYTGQYGVQAGETRSTHIQRNSVNIHSWSGYLGTVQYEINDEMKATVGADVRSYRGEHWREVRNLIGGDYFIDTVNQQNANPVKRLGDRVAYHNDGFTRWFGGFGQFDYRSGPLAAYVNFAASQSGYKRVDYFLAKVGGDWATADWEDIFGWNLKGGANYNLTDQLNVYGNLGHIDKAPIFDSIIDFANNVTDPIHNEKIDNVELGAGYRTYDNFLTVNAGMYMTSWKDRSWSRSIEDEATGIDYVYLLRGIDARHMGVELESTVRPHRMVEVRGMASIGSWKWLNDVNTTFAPEDQPSLIDTINVYVDGLPVGDAPQTTFAMSIRLFPIRGLYLDFVGRYSGNHWANFDPIERTDETDDADPWKIPEYTLFDVHFGYTLPLNYYGSTVEVFGHVFNLLDTMHITDAMDSSDHTATSVDVYMGRPRTFLGGLRVTI